MSLSGKFAFLDGKSRFELDITKAKGAGIPAEQLTHNFEPFYTTKQKGSGLGLMIEQRIVRDHGGRIELESRVAQGTTFKLWMPLPDRMPRLLPGGDDAAAGKPSR